MSEPDHPLRQRLASTQRNAVQIILLSGGLDSATALALACNQSSSPRALFVDYGQAAASSEALASAALAAHYSARHEVIHCSASQFGSGEIRGRNAFLIHLALMAFPANSGLIMIAIHGGTTYRDCSPDFVTLMQRSIDFHTDGTVTLATPFLGRSKGEVFSLALDLDVPVDLTYSCEAGNTACGRCLSCRDREELLART